MMDEPKVGTAGREGAAAKAKPGRAGAAERFAEAVRRAETSGRGARAAPDGREARPGETPGRNAPAGQAGGVRPPADRKTEDSDDGLSRPVRGAEAEETTEASPANEQTSVRPRPVTFAGEPANGQATNVQPVGVQTPKVAALETPALGAAAAAPATTDAPAPGQAAADALMPKLAPRMPASFAITFPPNAWPLIRAEGSRGPNGLNLRLTAADAKDEARLKSAIASLREALKGAGHVVGAITVLTDGE